MKRHVHNITNNIQKQLVIFFAIFVMIGLLIAQISLIVYFDTQNVFAYAFVLLVNSFAVTIVINWLSSFHESSIEELQENLETLSKATALKPLQSSGKTRESKKLTIHINKVILSANKEIHKLQKTIHDKEENLERITTQNKEKLQSFKELQILQDISDRITYSLNIPTTVEVIAGSMGKIISYTSISYVLLNEEKLNFHIRLEESVNSAYIKDIRNKMINSLASLTNSEGIKNISAEDIVTGSVINNKATSCVRSYFNGPLVIDGKTVGLLNVASTRDDHFSERQMSFLYTITKKVSVAIERLHEVLEEEKGKLNAMVASISDGLIMVDNNMRLMVINPALKIMLDLAVPEVSIFDVFDKLRDILDVRARFQDALSLDRLITADEVLLGELYLRPIFSPVRDKGGNKIGAIMLLQDVTKEHELQELREDFTSMMVHELRSPLDGIRKMGELMKDEKFKNDKKTLDEFLTIIHQNTTGMLELVNDLLDVAKIESGKFQLEKEQINLNHIIEQRIEFYTSSAKNANIKLISQYDPRAGRLLQGDPIRIIQVLNNFISNALKFTKKGGKVAIQSLLHKQGKDISVEAEKNNIKWFLEKNTEQINAFPDAVLVAVTDTGIGIPQEHITQLFNKFTQLNPSTTKSETKGTGLGLVITKGIIEAHDGIIGVESKEGKGSTFYFAIPLGTKERKRN